jgi:gamma-glutamyltranspeptidase/glutathione hydrolase
MLQGQADLGDLSAERHAAEAGERVVQAEYAETLKHIAQHGEAALYQRPLGDILVDYMKAHGGFIARQDLTSYKTVERAPIRADYRGWEILGPPPPAASGVHIAQMLNILEGYDIAAWALARPRPSICWPKC